MSSSACPVRIGRWPFVAVTSAPMSPAARGRNRCADLVANASGAAVNVLPSRVRWWFEHFTAPSVVVPRTRDRAVAAAAIAMTTQGGSSGWTRWIRSAVIPISVGLAAADGQYRVAARRRGGGATVLAVPVLTGTASDDAVFSIGA